MKPISILLIELVEDNPTFLHIATSFQEKHDDVNPTGDGIEALRQAQDPSPGDIFLDLGMPDFPGPEVIHRLRSELPELGIAAIAVLDTDKYRWAALRSGADNSDPKAASSADRLEDS